MRGSILDTNYAAMQTDLSKLQGEEEKRKIPLQNKGCLPQGNLLNLQGLALNVCLPKQVLKSHLDFIRK